MHSAQSRRGYTLVEVLVSLAIVSLVLAGACAFFIQNLSVYHMSVGKLRVNRDIRTLTTQLAEEARNANFFRIYPSFVTRYDDSDGNGVEGPGEDLPDGLAINRSGDLLVLYYWDPNGALEAGTSRRLVVRAVGYYRSAPTEADVAGAGPVRKFEVTVDPLTLPALGTVNSHDEVVELSRGLANGRLFHNFGGSIVVQGEIQHPGNLSRRATNTYNFTVGPRG